MIHPTPPLYDPLLHHPPYSLHESPTLALQGPKVGLFRLPAYVVNVMKVFAKFSGCNTHLLVGFYCLYVGEAWLCAM